MGRRDDFAPATRREIAERAGYMCSHPACGRITVGPSADRRAGVTMTGVAAHITAASSGGARYDDVISPAERRAASNGIWMCAVHAKWIDDNPSLATVPKLQSWKAAHEAEVAAWVEHGRPGIAGSWDRLAAISRDHRSTIVTHLPDGRHLARDAAPLIAELAEARAFFVSGESGVGKSALVMSTLDEFYPEAKQVWLGPQELGTALSELGRESLGLTAPLGELLRTTASGTNFLVLDSLERVGPETITRVSTLVASLLAEAGEGSSWRIVAVGQHEGFEAHLDPLLGALGRRRLNVGRLGRDQVRSVLRSVPALANHSRDEGLVAILGNLQALAWVAGAAQLFADEPIGDAGMWQIADRLWLHWTGGDPDLHSFMIRLARRDADFERSFGLGEMAPDDRAAWRAGRQRLPLTLDGKNRVGFEHDLASDWARYQFLKEIAHDVRRWAPLAKQPLWVAALRLLGQFLLREQEGFADAWSRALAEAKAAGDQNAVDVLLDALCLDAAADRMLASRKDLLLEDSGRLLERLLTRFTHVATVPDPIVAGMPTPDLALYAEVEFRTPIASAWVPVVRFLEDHRSEIGRIGSATVARVCGMWLAKTPPQIGGLPTPARGALTELAVATARVRQAEGLVERSWGSGSDETATVYKAALAGAEDCPDAVAGFALEMARRRPLDDEVRREVEVRRSMAMEGRRFSEEDRCRDEERTPLGLLGLRRLPPWPLGPAGRLDGGFRRAVLRQGALEPLMRADPGVAAEVLLACIVDDAPHEHAGGPSYDWSLGLVQEHDDRPTIFWNSPFLPLLITAPQVALDALLRLVDFCTRRWEADVRGSVPPPLRLRLSDGSSADFVGNAQVMDWSQTRRTTNGQLFSALDALERWLWLKIRGGEDDVRGLCSALLSRSRSAAILGVLCNCAKQDPVLLKEALAPLLSSPLVLVRDEMRLHQRVGGDAFAWLRAGEGARAIGMEWERAPHRHASLKRAVAILRRDDPAFDTEAAVRISAWSPEDVGGPLRLRALAAEIDPRNWHLAVGSGAEEGSVFRYPDDVAREMAELNPPESEPDPFSRSLEELAALLAEGLGSVEAEELFSRLDGTSCRSELTASERRSVEAATAAVLLVRAAPSFLRDADVAERLAVALERAVAESVGGVTDDDDRAVDPGVAWACLGAVHARAEGYRGRERWEGIIAAGLASGDPGLVRLLFRAARPFRRTLQDCYDAMEHAAALAAALDALRPRIDGEPGSVARIESWRRRLARRPLRTLGSGDLDLVVLAERVERFWRWRYGHASAATVAGRGLQPRRYSLGLSTHLLGPAFDWALDEEGTRPDVERSEECRALARLWRLVEWRSSGSPWDDAERSAELRVPDEFGMAVIRAIASRIAAWPAEEGAQLWRPVLALGPRGGFVLEHMFDCFFLRLYKGVDAGAFAATWEDMVATVMDPSWNRRGPWWRARDLMRHALGIDAAHQIACDARAKAQVARLVGFYEAFSSECLAGDARALAAFARFLASEAGAGLRVRAVSWLDLALQSTVPPLSGDVAEDLADFVRVVLEEHRAELVRERRARDALIGLIGRMVRDQVPYALALQDRVRALR